MAEQVEFGQGGAGKIRNFWIVILLSFVTFGIYGIFWYYLVNDELKDIGNAKGDQNLGTSSPAMSVAASLFGWVLLFIPTLLSYYNYGVRIQRAERLCGVPQDRQINPTLVFLLIFPGSIIVIPVFIALWMQIDHQNQALRAAAGQPFDGGVAATSII
jgi:hypothetical protein